MQLKAAKAFRSLLLPVPEKPYRKSYLYRKQMQQDRLPYTLTLIYAYNRPFRLYITYYAAVLFLLQDKKNQNKHDLFWFGGDEAIRTPAPLLTTYRISSDFESVELLRS